MKQITFTSLVSKKLFASRVGLTLGIITALWIVLPPNAMAQQYQTYQIHASAQTAKNLYSKITSGMTYQKVVAILGKQGEEGSRTETNGISAVGYSWRYPDGMIIGSFINNKLASKTLIILHSR